MSERIYYETAFSGFLAEGILLRENYGPGGRDDALLVECLGAAPLEEQPWEPDDPWPGAAWRETLTVREVHERYDPYLSGEDRDDEGELHVVYPRDVTKRFIVDDGEAPV